MLNARDAADRGAVIRTRAKVVEARREGEHWRILIEDTTTGRVDEVSARLIVNAAGPWVDRVLSETVSENDVHNVRLVQGSHIVVRRKFEDPRAYFFQNRDGRIIFAIPYEEEFTLIGTTDRDYVGDPAAVAISDEEIAYLCDAASEYFKEPVRREDIVWTYSGVRPLYDDGASKAQEATRDYVLTAHAPDGQAPLLNIFGGKITTYRRLAEAMLEKIEDAIGARGKKWTAAAPLPGGDFPVQGFEALVAELGAAHAYLAPSHVRRLARLYGTRARDMLRGVKGVAELGRHFGADLYEVEVRYLIANEWAQTAADILWRRTKRGLRLTPEQVASLEEFLREAGAGAKTQAA